MALIDVKEYYIKMLNQYLEIKEDLIDFEQGLKDGYITEDQLQAAISDHDNLKINLDRLTYIMYLFELPKRKSKKKVLKHKNENLLEYFKRVNATDDAVFDENVSTLSHLRQELNSFKKN